MINSVKTFEVIVGRVSDNHLEALSKFVLSISLISSVRNAGCRLKLSLGYWGAPDNQIV